MYMVAYKSKQQNGLKIKELNYLMPANYEFQI